MALRNFQDRFDRLSKRQQVILLSLLDEFESKTQQNSQESQHNISFDIEPFTLFPTLRPKNSLLSKVLKILWGNEECANPKAADLAKEVYVTPNYLQKLCKEQLGTTLTKIGQMFAVEKAKKLLKETDQQIIDISYSLGFSTQSHFNRIFKNITQKTPSEYRENSL